MVLQDHFRPPLSVRRHWHAFHNAWATYISSDLNQRLPEGYFAEANVQFGIEIDVVTFEEPGQDLLPAASELWIAPTPTQTVSITMLTDTVEVLLFNWLRGHLCLPVDLEATYTRTCREQRIMGNGM
jgi:hypothetical protein